MKVMHIDWYIFDECVLRDLDMSERNLNGAHFIKVDARGTFFIKSQLQESDFSGADLRNTLKGLTCAVRFLRARTCVEHVLRGV
jgi:uncharacterized protein YjbI with pentapeptide repeats